MNQFGDISRQAHQNVSTGKTSSKGSVSIFYCHLNFPEGIFFFIPQFRDWVFENVDPSKPNSSPFFFLGAFGAGGKPPHIRGKKPGTSIHTAQLTQ